MYRARRIATLLVAGALATGCAFGDRQANLTYPPVSDEVLISSAEAAPMLRGGEIYIADFSDVRSDQMVVGHVRNGLGMKTAKVVPQRDTPGWVREALVYELKASGYQVMDGNAPAGKTTISGDIVRVYCDAYLSYEGEVILRVEAAKAGVTVLQASYTGTGSAGLNWAATGDSYSQSLSMALQSALRQFIADLNQHDI